MSNEADVMTNESFVFVFVLHVNFYNFNEVIRHKNV